MSVILQSNLIMAGLAPLTPSGAKDLVCEVAEYNLAAALAANNVMEMMVLPPHMEVAAVALAVTDLDTGGSPAIVLRAGFMLGTPGDKTFANRTSSNAIGSELITASTVGQAGGIQVGNVVAMYNAHWSEVARSIGVQVATAPATGATTGKVVLQVMMRPFYRR